LKNSEKRGKTDKVFLLTQG